MLALLVRASWQVRPVQAPLNPEKLQPDAAVAVRFTAVPELNPVVHTVGQSTPPGLLVTVPLPATVRLNCSSCGGGRWGRGINRHLAGGCRARISHADRRDRMSSSSGGRGI